MHLLPHFPAGWVAAPWRCAGGRGDARGARGSSHGDADCSARRAVRTSASPRRACRPTGGRRSSSDTVLCQDLGPSAAPPPGAPLSVAFFCRAAPGDVPI